MAVGQAAAAPCRLVYLGLGIRASGALSYLGSESPPGSVYCQGEWEHQTPLSASGASGCVTKGDTAGSDLAFLFFTFPLHRLKPTEGLFLILITNLFLS